MFMFVFIYIIFAYSFAYSFTYSFTYCFINYYSIGYLNHMVKFLLHQQFFYHQMVIMQAFSHLQYLYHV